jgi:hypothetical protein
LKYSVMSVVAIAVSWQVKGKDSSVLREETYTTLYEKDAASFPPLWSKKDRRTCGSSGQI